MHLNVKFLQILSTIYISFESINSVNSNKIIPTLLMSKIQFFEIKHSAFSLNTYLHRQLQTIRMERESRHAKCRKKNNLKEDL